MSQGAALTSFFQCGELYRLDPRTLASLDPPRETWGGAFPTERGVSAHPKVDPCTGRLLFFNYATREPFLRYGEVSAEGALLRDVPVALPGPRLPHDMAFTPRFAVLNDLPVYWDEALLAKGVYRARFDRDRPTRFGLLSREPGASDSVRWFEAEPTYVLHFANAFEDGDEVVLDGYHQADPLPAPRPDDGPYGPLMRLVDLHALGTTLRRWRMNLRTGALREERLDDRVSEFPTIDPRRAGQRYRYVYAMTSKPGWFLFNGLVRHDLRTGAQQRYAYPEGVFASESPMAPREGSTGEDDGYLLTLVADLRTNSSECHVFDAAAIDRGPVARLQLPERVCSGTHACWASRDELAGRPSAPATNSGEG